MLTEKNGYPVYPLSVAQKFHFFYMNYCPMKSVVNIGNTLTIETELDFDELKKAIYKAIDRCESMRLRLTQDEDGTWYQYVVDHEDRDIEFVDFSDYSEDEANAIMTGWTQVPIALNDSPLNRIVMIKMPGGYSGIYALTHHLT
ncbi:MAG: condensation domain-containing protein, partial [Clostridiales bacterium]|nr:condensation domain-containing protein [Clostridiales bacterium]